MNIHLESIAMNENNKVGTNFLKSYVKYSY